jgi:hypothetical protein
LNERSWPRVTPPYRALDLNFSVRLAGADLADYIESILAPLATGKNGDADSPPHVFSVVDNGERFKNRYAVYFDGQHIVRTPSEHLALVYLLWQLNRAVVAESDRYLLLHSAAAEFGGSALLLPAPMNSGKTTLVAGLVNRGFGYLTDEAAAIDPASLDVDPFPKPLSIELGSWEALESIRPQLDARFARFAGDQWHVVPDAIRPGAAARACPARLVVSPRFEPAATTTIARMSKAEGVLLLAENAFNFASHKGEGLHTLAAVVRECDCYRLTFGSLEAACDEILNVVDQLEARV